VFQALQCGHLPVPSADAAALGAGVDGFVWPSGMILDETSSAPGQWLLETRHRQPVIGSAGWCTNGVLTVRISR
jgi:hypothetical protein